MSRSYLSQVLTPQTLMVLSTISFVWHAHSLACACSTARDTAVCQSATTYTLEELDQFNGGSHPVTQLCGYPFRASGTHIRIRYRLFVPYPLSSTFNISIKKSRDRQQKTADSSHDVRTIYRFFFFSSIGTPMLKKRNAGLAHQKAECLTSERLCHLQKSITWAI